MGQSGTNIDPDHEVKRATISRVGLAMLGLGVPCGLLGVGLFLSGFFLGPGAVMSPGRAVLGLVLTAVGGFLFVSGLQALALGNLGRIARYQAGETLPVAKDLFAETAPMAGDLARNLTRAVREGWKEGEAKIRHSCGTWNEEADRYCKGCGAAISERSCKSCQTPNDPDARFCDHCGEALDP